VATEVDGVWSVIGHKDLFDDDISTTDRFESLVNVTWEHIPGYLSNTSYSDSHPSMPDLGTVSKSSGSSAMSMPGLHAISDSLGTASNLSDWLSEARDVAQSDDSCSQLSSFDIISALADITLGEEDTVAAILTDVV
jgi:hypothetical protein